MLFSSAKKCHCQPCSRRCTLWSSPCFHVQEVGQFLPKGRALSVSMESELLARLYDYCLWGQNCWQDCPMGAQMGENYYRWGATNCVYLCPREIWIISIAVCGDTNCVYNLIQGGELLSVAVYWGHKWCVPSSKKRRIIVSCLIREWIHAKGQGDVGWYTQKAKTT